MTEKTRQGQSNHPALDRRSILLGSTTLAATSVLGSGPIQVAQAQQQTPCPPATAAKSRTSSSSSPTISAGSTSAPTTKELWRVETPNLDRMASENMRFTGYYAEGAAPLVGRISSPANCRFGL